MSLTLLNSNENKIISFKPNLCEELQQRIEKEIKLHIEQRKRNKLLDLLDEEELTVEEYNNIINNLEENFNKIVCKRSDFEDQNVRFDELKQYSQQLLIDEIERNKRERDELINFNNNLIKIRQELEYNYTYPINNLLDEIIKHINFYHQQLIDTIFEEFVNKVEKMCPKNDKSYKQTIKSVYIGRQSKKVIDLFTELTNKLTKLFTELINKIGKNEIFSTDFNNFKELMRLKSFLKNIVSDIFYSTITAEICYKIEQLPEKEMTDSNLVKTYSQSLLSQLNSFIIEEIPPKIEEKFNYYSKRIYNFNEKFVKNISNKVIVEEIDNDLQSKTQQNCDNNSIKSNQIEIENNSVETKTIDSFINTLSLDLIEVNQLTELYNEYFNLINDKRISSKGFGKILKNNSRLKKTIKKIKGKKYTYYQRLN